MNWRLHKRKLIAGAAVFALLAAFFMLPLALRPSLEMVLRSNGFPKASVGQISFMPDGLFIDQITLDPNGFSLIDDIQISGSWRDLLLKTKANRISVKNVELSGEIDEANRLIIAGWDGKFGDANSGKSQNLPFNTLYIDGATFDLDTEAGAIRLEGKAALEKSGNHEKILNAAFWTSQKQLTAALNLQGRLNDKNEFSGKAEIANGGIDMAPLSLSRLSGWIEFKTGSEAAASGQIMAGGMKLNDIPFEDVNFAFDSMQNSRALFKTKVTGRPVTLEGELLTAPSSVLNLRIAATSLQDIFSLGELEAGDEDKLLKNTGPVEISTSIGPDAISGAIVPFKTSLSFTALQTSITADINYDRVNKKLSGILTPVTISATDVSSLFSLPEKTGLNFQSGDVFLSGGFGWDMSKKPIEITGPIDIKLSGANGDFSNYKFENLRGNVSLTSLFPWQISAKQKLELSRLGAGKDLTDASLIVAGGPEKLTIYDFQSDFAGGKLSLMPFIWDMKATTNSMTVKITNMRLSELVGTSSSLKAEGEIVGSIPLKWSDKDVAIEQAVLSSTGSGSFKYVPDKLPESLQGDDARMKTVRLALSDYRYDNLQVTIDGPLNGDLKTTLKASGKSPVFESRQVNLNLNLEGALAAALKQALQPSGLTSKIQGKLDGKK